MALLAMPVEAPVPAVTASTCCFQYCNCLISAAAAAAAALLALTDDRQVCQLCV
jgi:hypothetical protein